MGETLRTPGQIAMGNFNIQQIISVVRKPMHAAQEEDEADCIIQIAQLPFRSGSPHPSKLVSSSAIPGSCRAHS